MATWKERNDRRRKARQSGAHRHRNESDHPTWMARAARKLRKLLRRKPRHTRRVAA